MLYDVETLPGEDKYRTGPQVGKKFPPGITPRKAYPDPTGDPFENLKQFLTLFYCCYDITGNFTLLGEPIPGGDGVDIKAAMIVEIEEGKDNPVPPHPKHVSGYLDGSKLNDALKARKGAETDWDDVDVTFTLKPGVATSTESVPPSGSDLARRFAREQPEFKLERIVFTDRRTKMKAKYPDRKPK